MTKTGAKRSRRRQFRTFDPENESDDSDTQSNSSYDGDTSDDNIHVAVSTPPSGPRPNSMNVNAVSFSPGLQEQKLTATAASFTPNPYMHITTSNRSDMFQITPTKVSPQDIYEYQRLPSGVVTTTQGGQQVEFWERVHVPESQKHCTHHHNSWNDRNHAQWRYHVQ